MEENFELFLNSIDSNHQEFVRGLHTYLLQSNCTCDIKTAKSGYVVSYIRNENKKILANFVMRKSGVKIRMYLEHIKEYQDFLHKLPDKMKKEIKKASVCKRMLDPNDCNPRCTMGYCFEMEDEVYKKCKYMAFMPTLHKDTNPYIQQLLEHELKYQ